MSGTVVVFGGSGGIGLATARRLRERGYGLHLVGRDPDRLAEAAREVGAGSTAGDVLDEGLFAQVAREAGTPLAGLVYSVGTMRLGSLSRLKIADVLEDFQVNALGAALAIQACLPALKASEGGAAVVLFSSVAARQGFPLHSGIGMVKGAVEGLVVSLAAELAPRVRVNAVAPSLTRTRLSEGVLRNAQVAEGIAAAHPLGRLGDPDDIAALAAFLISADSSWVTGQVVGVDGGRSTLRVKA
jgi:NAD(P)-dependent dehydrogenase (short-subunit alcohol dehydrogenase family)